MTSNMLSETMTNNPLMMNAHLYGLILVNNLGRIYVFNEGAERILKIPKTLAVGKSIKELLPVTGERFLGCLHNNAFVEGQLIEEVSLGLIVDIYPVENDNQTFGAVCLIHELNKFEKIQSQVDELRKINSQFDAIFDSSYDGLFISDGTGKILRCNQSSESLIGHKQGEIVGQNVRELILRGYIDKSVTLEVLQQRTSLTMLQELRNGKTILVTGTPVFNGEGQIEFVVTNERDITALNRMKRELREYKILTRKLGDRGPSVSANPLINKDIVAVDKKTREIFETAKIVAKFDTKVLIQGESGVGKGLVARYIHDSSQRNEGPFVQINCGAIPNQLIESELFGYIKGSFTGAATTGKQGLFQMADKGTLFLDEIGEIPLDVQVKFLKAIEDKEIQAVGDTKPRKIDVRIIAASNSDLNEMVASGQFREDLFFRLNVIPIDIPPLRSRKDDIFPMISKHIDTLNSRFGTLKTISTEAMDVLTSYSYPGNVRELENIIERIVILCPEDEICTSHLPAYLTKQQPVGDWLDPEKEGLTLKDALKRYEHELISNAIDKHGSKAKAARALGVDPSTIVRKSLKYQATTGSAILHY